jgi:hypothetical protein
MFEMLSHSDRPAKKGTVSSRSTWSKPQRWAAVTLTSEQVTLLDNRLRHYRLRGKGGCTTRDRVTVTWGFQGRRDMQESFLDDTCSDTQLGDADLRDLATLGILEPPHLSLSQLTTAADEGYRRNQKTISYVPMPRERTGAYRMAARKRRDEKAARDIRTWPGYAALEREFMVEEVSEGHINLLPYSIHPTLKARTVRTVDGAWWFNPVEKGKPRYNWNDFLAVHREVESVVARHSWVAAWRAANPGRSVESHIFGIIPTDEDDVTAYVMPAWKHAGLKGLPRYLVLLRRPDRTWASVYLGKDDPRALIVSCEPSRTDKSGLLLDSLDCFYSPTDKIPDYATVTPDGRLKRNPRRK